MTIHDPVYPGCTSIKSAIEVQQKETHTRNSTHYQQPNGKRIAVRPTPKVPCCAADAVSALPCGSHQVGRPAKRAFFRSCYVPRAAPFMSYEFTYGIIFVINDTVIRYAL